ncbi:MAG: TDP-N-acetylfucosamine:lipid II N-acetylfucosaminyltransferase [Deltaproteobacteria bacterium]
MKIMHFAIDDKFIPFIQKTFEQALPGCNEYRIPGDPSKPLNFVRPGENVRVVESPYWISDALTRELQNYDCLIIHFMTPNFVEGIKRTPDNMLVCWVGWGGDYYDLIGPYLGNLILPQTQALMDKISRRHALIPQKIMKFVRSPRLIIPLLKQILHQIHHTQNAGIPDIIDRVDLLWVNPEEMSMIEKALPAFRGVYHRICCYSAEEVFSFGPDRMSGPDILIGNSADATNNHLELFDMLQQLDLGESRLITPLSYGNADYGDTIMRIGQKQFGHRFIAIRKFMALENYYGAIANCGTVIMNHIRQQAGTTIATALFKGAKIYLRNENPLMPFYRKMGIRLFSIQDDLLQSENPFAPMSSDEIIRHRMILNRYWSHDVAISAVLGLKDHVEKKRRAYA